jgi:hypothetical protein
MLKDDPNGSSDPGEVDPPSDQKSAALSYSFYTGDRSQQSSPILVKDCIDDSEAFSIALGISTTSFSVEAWLGFRLVCRVPAKRRPGK